MNTIKQWMEERGNSTDESSRLPQENMSEEVLERYVLSDGSEVAFTATSYVISHAAGHDAGEDFDSEQPDWAEEVRAAREK
jgi:hypothetical protein